jgi:hypothetical protein
LKYLKEKKLFFIYFFIFIKFQVPWDPRIAVSDESCAAALVGLKYCKKKNLKLKEKI